MGTLPHGCIMKCPLDQRAQMGHISFTGRKLERNTSAHGIISILVDVGASLGHNHLSQAMYNCSMQCAHAPMMNDRSGQRKEVSKGDVALQSGMVGKLVGQFLIKLR